MALSLSQTTGKCITAALGTEFVKEPVNPKPLLFCFKRGYLSYIIVKIVFYVIFSLLPK